jgi:nucleoside-diphosphate-sugar epimerase
MGEVILITGATGFIGQHLAKRYLTDKAVEKLVLVTNTRKFDPKALQKLGVEIKDAVDFEALTLDLTKVSEVERLGTRDVSLVVHSAGTLGGANISRESLFLSNFRGTKNLVDYYSGDWCVRQFVLISSFAALGPIPASKIPADETLPLNPSNAYEESKACAEEYVVGSDLPYTVIRPEFVYGPGDTHMLPLFQSVLSDRFILIDGGRSYVHPTYIDDVVQGIGLSLGNEKAAHEIFNIVGERYVTVREFAEHIYFALHHKKLKCRSLDRNSMLLLARLCDIANKVVKTNLPLSTSRVRLFSENRAADYSKAARVLGYRPVSLDRGLEATIAWYFENGYL